MGEPTPSVESLWSKHRARWKPAEPYEPLPLRTYRAISWLRAARDQGAGNPDVAFILRWIAFNAAYAQDLSPRRPQELDALVLYLETLVDVDTRRSIDKAIWHKSSGTIGRLLDNQYIFNPFWSHAKEKESNSDWEQQLKNEGRQVVDTVKEHRSESTKMILTTLFPRLYTLRNQLVHGGATWNGSLNRDSVDDGARVLGFLVPTFIDVMIDNPSRDWGDPHYLARPALRIAERSSTAKPTP